MERYVYYACLFCGCPEVPSFHFEGDPLFEFHMMFMKGKRVEEFEAGEVEF